MREMKHMFANMFRKKYNDIIDQEEKDKVITDLDKLISNHVVRTEKQGLPLMSGLTTDFNGELMFSQVNQ
jgi:hypothetical protein